jgi:penicillin-binding protein 1A
MGIKSKLEPIYSLALGGSEVNLLELTSAYGTLAAEGKYTPPHGIVRVRDRRGEVIYEPKFAAKQAVDRDSAAIVTWMLESVVNAGTGGPAQLPDRPVAGKTGTSDEARDLWFIGYIPQLVVGVWLGNDDNYPTWGSSGTAAFTWGEFMEKVTEDIPVANFPEVPTWEGREPTIKAQPVQPNSVLYGDTTPDNAQKVENVSVTNEYEYQQGYE